MYIQPPPSEREPFFIPKGYSGNAFRRPLKEQSPPPDPGGEREEQPLPEIGQEMVENVMENEHIPPNGMENEGGESFGQSEGEPTLPVMVQNGAEKEKSHPTGGILSRIPFLSSLLPPPRGGGSAGSRLPEWVVIGAVILLLAGDEDGSDVLPFLLLLLLWD